MSLDTWNSRPIEHMLHERINDLESRITLAIDLSISCDGFNDVEGLKSLVDDMVLASKAGLGVSRRNGKRLEEIKHYYAAVR